MLRVQVLLQSDGLVVAQSHELRPPRAVPLPFPRLNFDLKFLWPLAVVISVAVCEISIPFAGRSNGQN